MFIEIRKVTPNKRETTASGPCYDVSVYKVKAEVDEDWTAGVMGGDREWAEW